MRGKYKELDERLRYVEGFIEGALDILKKDKEERKQRREQREQRSEQREQRSEQEKKESEEYWQRFNSLCAYLENRFRPEIEKEQQKNKSEKDTGQQVN